MRIKSLAVLLLIFAGQLLVSAQTEKEISAIRAEVNLINKSSSKYTKKTKNIEGLSLEGTEATYFLSGQNVRKITAKIYGETYNSAAEIYYSGDKPIFIFSKLNKYDASIGSAKTPKVVSSEERRIYFDDGKVLRILLGKAVLKPTDIRFSEIEQSLTELSENLKAAYSK